MLRSLYSAVSGIGVNQKSMDVIGNNIANVNTIGYKTGRAVFQDMISQTLTGGKTPSDSRGGINPRQVGLGSFLAAVDNIFEQGAIKSTARTHDLAIEGNGFFVVRGEGLDRYYTRAGDLNFDITGTLTTPSGYKVQGWMADPVTGVLRSNSDAQDISLTPAHQTMQARKTSEIQYAGVLDTRATASQSVFNKLLTQASATQDIFSLKTSAGQDSDLTSSDNLRVRAHATNITSMANVFNRTENGAGLTNGQTIGITIGGTFHNLSFKSTGGGGLGSKEFSTLGELAAEIDNLLPADANVTVVNGRINIQGGATPFNIDSISIPSNSSLLNIFTPLTGAYNGQANQSGEMFFQTDIRAGESFRNMTEMTAAIQNAMNGNVVPGNFAANFLDNNFGLNNGDTVTYHYKIAGTAYSTTMKYSSTPNPTVAGEFHTVQDFVQLIVGDMNTQNVANHGGGAGEIAFAIEGNKFTIQNNSANNLEFSTSPTSTDRLIPPTTNVSPYLENLLDARAGVISGPGARNVEFDAIAGKGRVVYSNNNAPGTDITGFSINKTLSGDKFNNNILTTQNGDIRGNSSAMSHQFLTTATENALMLDLFAENGASLNFVEGRSNINFNAEVGGERLTNANSFSVGVDTKLVDMMRSLENYLGLGPSFNSTDNVTFTDGVMMVTGEKGLSNAITALTVTAIPESIMTTFNNQFSTPTTKATATGGQVVSDMRIFDEQGNPHVIQFEFSLFNEERNEWAMTVKSDDPANTVAINGATTNRIIMNFNSNGTPNYMYDPFTTPINVISNPTLRFTPNNGTNTIDNIALRLGTPGEFDGLVLSRANSTFNIAQQDGFPLGILEQKMFNQAGEIVGYYTNGQVRTIGQVALAVFQNNQGLLKVGNTMFAETGNSGQAAIGKAQSGSRGDIASSALEASNVDISEEFVNMIVTERGFQANSRVVTTSDEMIQELLNLKR